MERIAETPLGLGGHSFISQLGNEPMPSLGAQRDIVEACLDNGIRWFDTTHRPERVGLGRALEALGRRDEAKIIAWNFLEDVGSGPDDKLDRPRRFEAGVLEELLAQLRTDYIDGLVIHELDKKDDPASEAKIEAEQEAVAVDWLKRGSVRQLGVWAPGGDAEEKYGIDNPYTFMLMPLNVRQRANAPSFAASKRLGWTTFAVSPFIRGWELDSMVERALARGGDEGEVRSKLADLMLRFALFCPDVDYVVTGMRRVEWIAANVESVERGPLDEAETEWLDALCG
jgi:aryl-alcohol dehydrogenase-like predicted oxidoreductase